MNPLKKEKQKIRKTKIRQEKKVGEKTDFVFIIVLA
jgi:hypothetical protein